MKEHVSISVPYATPYFPIAQRKGPGILIIFPMALNFHVFSRVLFLVEPQIINDARKIYRSEDIPSQIGKRFSFMQSRVATTRYSSTSQDSGEKAPRDLGIRLSSFISVAKGVLVFSFEYEIIVKQNSPEITVKPYHRGKSTSLRSPIFVLLPLMDRRGTSGCDLHSITIMTGSDGIGSQVST
jgi:hypothetical protein